MSIASALRLTNADLEAMPENGNRYEVIDGALFMSGPPSYIQQSTLVNIAFGIDRYLQKHPIGRVLPCVGVILDDPNQRRDRHVKRSLYDSRGVAEYWLVDPENRIVELHLRNHAGESTHSSYNQP